MTCNRNVNKWDYFKMKNACSLKDVVKREKKEAMDLNKIFVKHKSLSRVYNNTIIEGRNNPIKNGSFQQCFVKEDIWISSKSLKISVSSVIHYTPTGITKTTHKKWTASNVGVDVEQLEFSHTAGGNAEQLQSLWKTSWRFLRTLNTDNI